MSRKMPAQKPGASKQDYGSPPAFLRAVEARFGRIVWDLAAHASNSVCGDRYFGPGSRWGENSLERAWDLIPGVRTGEGLLWLNPPFGKIKPWARKCQAEASFGARIAMLVPLSGGNWFADYVEESAFVLPIRPRFPFVGQEPNPKTGKLDPYPKDLMLCVYNPPTVFHVGFETWRWDRPAGGEVAA